MNAYRDPDNKCERPGCRATLDPDGQCPKAYQHEISDQKAQEAAAAMTERHRQAEQSAGAELASDASGLTAPPSGIVSQLVTTPQSAPNEAPITPRQFSVDPERDRCLECGSPLEGDGTCPITDQHEAERHHGEKEPSDQDDAERQNHSENVEPLL